MDAAETPPAVGVSPSDKTNGMLVVGIFWLVFTIIAAIKANEGIRCRYPFAIRFLK